MGVAGLAAGGGLVGLNARWPLDALAAQQTTVVPDEILNPVEISGPEAVPILGRLPGARRMYMLPADKGEFHLIGSQVMTRMARPVDAANVYEFAIFTGRTSAAMPRHLHRGSHAALLVMSGEVELELNGNRWRMMRGDFANIPPGTPHGWTMRSDRSQIALFTMGDRVGAAFMSMGAPHTESAAPAGAVAAIPPGKLANAADAGDFQLVPEPAAAPGALRVSNLVLPSAAGPYVLLDGGGKRYGGKPNAEDFI